MRVGRGGGGGGGRAEVGKVVGQGSGEGREENEGRVGERVRGGGRGDWGLRNAAPRHMGG